MRIVHLASTLGPTGTARSLSLLAPALAELGEDQLVLNLGPADPFAADLAAANVAVRPVRFRNGLDPTGVIPLRNAVASFLPDVVHVWGNRAAVLSNWLRLPVVDSAAPRVAFDVRPDRWLAKRATRFAVVMPSPLLLGPRPAAALRPSAFGLSEDARLVVSVTTFEPRTDPVAALTAFDVLKHTVPDVHLLFVGDGPGRERAERMNRAVAFDDDRVRFLGVRNDVRAILAAASVVLISHREGGRTVVAEAVAAGRPVVAYRTPELAAIVRDGENGILVPVADAPALAAGLYRVLTDPTLAAKLSGTPGTLADNTSPTTAAREWQAIYRTVSG